MNFARDYTDARSLVRVFIGADTYGMRRILLDENGLAISQRFNYGRYVEERAKGPFGPWCAK